MLRVCLVGLMAGGHSGVPRYAALLSAALGRVATEFPQLSLQLLTTQRGSSRAQAENITVQQLGGIFAQANSGPFRIIAEQLHAARADADLLHFFDLTGPLLAPGNPFVTTVHDLAPLHISKRARMLHKRLLQPWAIQHARAAVAVSAFAKDEATSLLDADPARIRVIYPGPGLTPLDSAAWTDTPNHLLYVGNFAPHKNLPFLVRAFAAAGIDIPLLLVGKGSQHYGALRKAIRAAGVESRVEIRTQVSDAELDQLYRCAAAVALPSRYEGFGFTPLEAMARGCPVLASDIPALREVSGDGSLLLPVDDELSWADAIRRVAADAPLRESLRRRGEMTVGRYSWDETARGLCRLFLEVGS